MQHGETVLTIQPLEPQGLTAEHVACCHSNEPRYPLAEGDRLVPTHADDGLHVLIQRSAIRRSSSVVVSDEPPILRIRHLGDLQIERAAEDDLVGGGLVLVTAVFVLGRAHDESARGNEDEAHADRVLECNGDSKDSGEVELLLGGVRPRREALQRRHVGIPTGARARARPYAAAAAGKNEQCQECERLRAGGAIGIKTSARRQRRRREPRARSHSSARLQGSPPFAGAPSPPQPERERQRLTLACEAADAEGP